MSNNITFMNLTPHEINLVEGDKTTTFQPSGVVARLDVSVDGTGIIRERSFGKLMGLPAPQEGVVYIVSSLAMQVALKEGRCDVVTSVGDIRDNKGRIIGTTHFVRDKN